MNFTLGRDKTVATLQGHTIVFKKGEPTHVPPECYKEVIAVGAIPEEEVPEPARNENEPKDPEARKAKIFQAFKTIKEGNIRDNFGGTGTPKVEAVSTIVGFRIDSRERDALWQEFIKPTE